MLKWQLLSPRSSTFSFAWSVVIRLRLKMYSSTFNRFGFSTLFVLYFCQETTTVGAEYLGCYNDQSENRLLSELREWNDQLTPRACIEICSKGGYPFAGPQWGSECYCGYNRPPQIAKRPESECSKQCSGDPQEKCGGNYRLSVYTTEVSAVGALPSGFILGCFKENEKENVLISERLLPGIFQVFDSLTPKMCFEFCFKKGYKLAGLQYGKECFCSNSKLDMTKKVEDSECATPCPGDATKKCGGGWRLSVYATGLTELPANGRLVGCYSDNPKAKGENNQPENRRVLPDFKIDLPATNSPRTCMNICHQMGFSYSGVQYEFECFCGLQGPPQHRIRPDDNCSKKCPGDPTETCGANWRIQVYKTPLADKMDPKFPDSTPSPAKTTAPPIRSTTQRNCVLSTTIVKGKRACRNSVIFSEDFKKFDPGRWRHEIKMAAKPDYEFTVYDVKPENTYTKDGILHIQPSVFDDNFVENGRIELERCTGDAFNDECSRNTDFFILPPIQSARISTKQKFSFKYGIVEIQAKLPIGDWIVPEIWLMPADNAYGSYYESGKIRFTSRGNSNLKYKDASDMGCQTLEGSVMMGYGQAIKTKPVYFSNTNGWRDDFHNFTIIWSPDDISFLVDGAKRQNVMQNAHGSRLSDMVGFSSSEIRVWNAGSPIAPFDQPFYISLGVSVGGIRDFEDGATSNGRAKPWSNTDPRALLKFWNQRSEWLPTWQKDTSLVIKSIKVTAL